MGPGPVCQLHGKGTGVIPGKETGRQSCVTFCCGLQWDRVLCSFFFLIAQCICVFVLTLFLPAPGLCSPCHPGWQPSGSRWAHSSHASSLSASCVSIWPSGGLPSTVLPGCVVGVELQEADGWNILCTGLLRVTCCLQ